MRPKIYFTLKVAALIVVALSVLVVSILLFNFILFTLRISGHESLLSFGPRGLLIFIQLFPWELLFIDIVLVTLLEWLLRQFRFGYKMPVLYLLTGIFVVTVFAGLLIDRGTRINDDLLGRADRHELPLIGEFFEHARRPPPPGSGVCRCVVTAIDGNSITVYNADIGSSSVLTVLVPKDDPNATTSLKIGDVLFIAGDVHDSNIKAFGIHRFEP